MERFGAVGRDGKLVSCVAFTDTIYGGVVIVDGNLYGYVGKRDAQAL